MDSVRAIVTGTSTTVRRGSGCVCFCYIFCIYFFVSCDNQNCSTDQVFFKVLLTRCGQNNCANFFPETADKYLDFFALICFDFIGGYEIYDTS